MARKQVRGEWNCRWNGEADALVGLRFAEPTLQSTWFAEPGLWIDEHGAWIDEW